jgi:hypothetical protein
MITLLIVAALVLYLVIGFLAARWQLPRIWARVRKESSGSFLSPEVQDRMYRDELQPRVRHRMVVNALIWPWALPASIITSNLNKVVDRGDPVWEARRLTGQLAERERKLAERSRRVKELEQELGIASDPNL